MFTLWDMTKYVLVLVSDVDISMSINNDSEFLQQYQNKSVKVNIISIWKYHESILWIYP